MTHPTRYLVGHVRMNTFYTQPDGYELIKWCGFNNQALHVYTRTCDSSCLLYTCTHCSRNPFTLFPLREVYNLWLNLFFSEIACKPRLFIRSKSSLYSNRAGTRYKRSGSWLPMINLAVIDFSRRNTKNIHLDGPSGNKVRANEAIKSWGKLNKETMLCNIPV